MPDNRQAPDRTPAHPSRGRSRVFTVRVKEPDADRLDAALDERGLSRSDYLRSLILGDLETVT